MKIEKVVFGLLGASVYMENGNIILKHGSSVKVVMENVEITGDVDSLEACPGPEGQFTASIKLSSTTKPISFDNIKEITSTTLTR
jgi:hypothetical protein